MAAFPGYFKDLIDGPSTGFDQYLSSTTDINSLDASGATLLMCTVAFGTAEHVRSTLGAGADPNQLMLAPVRGMTPLAAAAASGNVEAATMLLVAGADPTATDDEGLSVLDHAEMYSDENDDYRIVNLVSDALDALEQERTRALSSAPLLLDARELADRLLKCIDAMRQRYRAFIAQDLPARCTFEAASSAECGTQTTERSWSTVEEVVANYLHDGTIPQLMISIAAIAGAPHDRLIVEIRELNADSIDLRDARQLSAIMFADYSPFSFGMPAIPTAWMVDSSGRKFTGEIRAYQLDWIQSLRRNGKFSLPIRLSVS